jgi:hypothetical protein
MEALGSVVALGFTILAVRLLTPFINGYFSRPGFQERREQKAKLPEWYKGMELLFFLASFIPIVVFGFSQFFLKHTDQNALTVGQFIAGMAFLLTAVPVSGLLCNFVLWLVPPLRRISEENAMGVKGLSFRDSNTDLLRILGFMLIFDVIAALILILGY